MKKIELLAPAGDLEKLKTAIRYGADAVYFGGEMFSLRAGAGNLNLEEMKEGLAYAHERGKRCYLTINIYAHNEDIDPLYDYLRQIRDLDIDAFLIADPGIIAMVRETIPDAEIHLSTQANLTNWRTGAFWASAGVKRLVMARELSLEEIRSVRDHLPQDVELEAFVHGAMCISYSGRCLLSNFMTGRDSNRGMCAHPCRYRYSLVEEKRPGEFFPIEEDDRGSYIMNSKDLCMIRHIPDLVHAGIDSAKIEGRMKSIFYVATVVHAYRQAIDAYYEDPDNYVFREEWMEELLKASHREFTTGFYYGKPGHEEQNYRTSRYTKEYSFIGKVLSYNEETGIAKVEQRNKMNVGDHIEVFGPDISFFPMTITDLADWESGEKLESAPHAQQILAMHMAEPVKPGYILRKKEG
ncbi:peptidase U32 family protein [Eubacterium pyruvativorans]|nr:U32 family peptidase [Eubacterium pyruvativorans]MCI5747082.1 U32 family peptidase [Eubacterium pyruvativorans]MDD6707682.1 U32 family peptidase [Eubacterium pyruvativorans]MDO5567916.1 U32 family peptidase [Eubacteriales bacterium]MDY4050083.1 U32 family peptidase [Eubacterium pyruvativorans]